MPTYADPDLFNWMSVLSRMRAGVSGAATFEAAAGVVVRELYASYEESTALARVYIVLPYAKLDDGNRAFVDALTESAGQPPLSASTPVLTLAATRGARPEWSDRTLSAGHRGIPLISPTFVHAIPMLAGLLKEIGVELDFVETKAALNTQRLLANNGVFFVGDAAAAKDDEQRLLIPAQDFVTEQNVKSVFGMGGAYGDGTLAVIILFTREALSRAKVERLTPLISLLKSETARLVADGKVFAPTQ